MSAATSDPAFALTALSPLDGRYAAKVAPLASQFSEFGSMRARVSVEVSWFLALAAEVAPLDAPARAAVEGAAASFSTDDAARIKAIER
jgi:adenylosuccinate lyase